jgi:hypothetical protein
MQTRWRSARCSPGRCAPPPPPPPVQGCPTRLQAAGKRPWGTPVTPHTPPDTPERAHTGNQRTHGRATANHRTHTHALPCTMAHAAPPHTGGGLTLRHGRRPQRVISHHHHHQAKAMRTSLRTGAGRRRDSLEPPSHTCNSLSLKSVRAVDRGGVHSKQDQSSGGNGDGALDKCARPIHSHHGLHPARTGPGSRDGGQRAAHHHQYILHKQG